MSPRTIGGFAHGMAHDGHIHHENHEFTGAEGPVPMFTFSRGLDLHPRDLDPVAYGGHTIGTALCGSILEFTYIGGQYPLSP